jgi:hypothetical protein
MFSATRISALVTLIVAFIFLVVDAHCQNFSATAVPDATPSPDQIDDFAHQVVTPLPPALPNNPEPIVKARFWTIRRVDTPPLRNPFKTKTFWTTQAAIWSTTAWDARTNNCRANYPCGRDMIVDAYVPAAAVSVMQWVADRYMWRPLSLGPVGYLLYLHIKGGATGQYH